MGPLYAATPTGYAEVLANIYRHTLLSSAALANNHIYLEAECGTLGGEWEVKAVAGTSNGYAIACPQGVYNNPVNPTPTNTATWTFDAAVAGNYSLYLRSLATNNGDDSYYLRLNGGSWYKFNDMPHAATYQWSRVWDSDNAKAYVDFPLLAGTNTLEISYREYARLDKILFTDNATAPTGLGAATACGTSFIEQVYVEMECGSLGADWSVVTDGTTANGAYIQCPSPSSNDPHNGSAAREVSYTVNLARQGGYAIHFRGVSTDPGNDSYWVRANGGPWYKFNDQPNTGTAWQWRRAWDSDNGKRPLVLPLVAGDNTLQIAYREHIKLDKFYLTNADDSPSGLGTAVGCSTAGVNEIFLEAEHGFAGAQWTTVSDVSRSDSAYVQYPGSINWAGTTDTAYSLIYDVPVRTAGNYGMYFLLDSPDGSSDSYWVRVDDGDWMLYHANLTTGWAWDAVDSNQVAFTLALDAGFHRLEVQPREASRLDKILLTDAPTPPAAAGGMAVNQPLDISVQPLQPLYLQQYQNVPGGNLSDFGAHPGYPEVPDTTLAMSGFSVPGLGQQHYGGQTDGYLVPSETGFYRFNICADDASELLISTNDLADHLTYTAGSSAWAAPGAHNKYPEQTSALHYLEAGRVYAVRARYKQGVGGDHLYVYWKTPNNSTWQLIDEAYLAPARPVEICDNGLDDDLDGLYDGQDAECQTRMAGNAQAYDLSEPLVMGWWRGVAPIALSTMDNDPTYPDAPDTTYTLSGGLTSDHQNQEAVAGSVRGYLIPPQSGAYRFNLTADDRGRFSLSPNDDFTNLQVRGSAPDWIAVGDHTKFAEQTSNYVYLAKDSLYAFDLTFLNGVYGGHGTVYWQTPTDPTWQVVPAAVLSPYLVTEICGNGIDDDGNGQIDGDDVHCMVVPVLADDPLSGCPGGQLVHNVLDNDTDIHPDHTLVIVTPPGSGVATFNAAGVLTYTPTDASCVNDEFYYAVCNGGVKCDTARVVLNNNDAVAPTMSWRQQLAGGVELQAGRAENLSVGGHPITFPQPFTTVPVVLAQVVSDYGGIPLTARVSGVTTTGFTLQLQTEEAGGNPPLAETVSWIAAETGSAPGMRIGRTGPGVNENPYTQPFGQSIDQPVLLATDQSFNGVDPLHLRLTSLTNTGFTSYAQEETSGDPEVAHGNEVVGYAAFERGLLRNAAGQIIGETGTLDMAQAMSTWAKVYTQYEYHRPVVIVSPPTNNDTDPVTTRVRALSGKSFEIGLQEWLYQDRIHGTETLQFIVLESAAPISQVAICGSEPGNPPLADFAGLDDCSAAPAITLNTTACDDAYVSFYVKNDTMRYILPQLDTPDPANAGATVAGLKLTYMCSDDPAIDLRWRIRNPNPYPVFVERVDIYYVPQQGGLLVPANTDIFFFTKRENGSNTLRIHWRDQAGALKSVTKAAGSQKCNDPLELKADCFCADSYKYQVTDACGNATEYTQVQYIIDQSAPTFTAPADITIRCDQNMADLTITGAVTNVIDACVTTAPPATYIDSLLLFDPATKVRTYRRAWRQTDGCDNPAYATQIITVRACSDDPQDGLDNDGDGAADCADTEWTNLGAWINVETPTAQCPDTAFIFKAGDPAYRHYVVPLGWYYTGVKQRLFFALDDDNAPKNGTVHFANIKIYETTCDGCAPIKLDDYTVSSYGNSQDFGQYAFTEGGYGIVMWNNAWKAIDFPYDVTPNTVIEFDYYSLYEAEIHGIGLDDDNGSNSTHTIQLHGTQTYGIQDFSYDLPTYSWNFGANATPATATGRGPHTVRYPNSATHTPILTLEQSGCTQTATQPITTHPKSDAVDDMVITGCAGVVITDNVLGNDALVPGTFTLSVIQQPTNGAVTLEPNGTFVYTPAGIVCADAVFDYQICDTSTGCCDVATVTLKIDDTTGPTMANLPNALDSIFCDENIPTASNVQLVDNCPGIGLAYNETDNKGSSGCSANNYRLDRSWAALDACGNRSDFTQQLYVFDQTAPDIFRIHELPGGQTLIGGVMENVTHRWKQVRFPVLFDTQPLVFAQLSSQNELGAARVRIRNVTATSFEVRLLEEATADGRHGSEDVSWIALETGGNSGNWYARRDTLGVLTGQGKALEGGFGGNSQLFGQMQTTAWPEATSLRRWNQTATAVNLRADAPAGAHDYNLPYTPETIGLLQLPNGPLYNAAGERIGEVGTLTTSHALKTQQLTGRYHTPVVITGVLSLNGGAAAATRLTAITDTSFTVFVDELDYDDGFHASEQIPYLVLEGNLPADVTVDCHTIPDGPEIGNELRAVDNGDASATILFTETVMSTDCADWKIRRDYFASDACGNTTTRSYTITVLDTIAPAFTVPADLTVICGYDRQNLLLTGSPTGLADLCDPAPVITYSDDSTALVACEGLVLRQWTATDRCGNATIANQRIFMLNDTDLDDDGVPDALDLDTDNDGHADVLEGYGDADGDGIPNHKDLDSDNDGISDLLEGGHSDVDGDGVVDNFLFLGWDMDGDGLAAGFDSNDQDTSVAASATMDLYDLHHDRDQDGIPNLLDLDSDNDGLTDLLEAGGVDTDGDGRIDRPDPMNPFSIPDADFDGYADYYDPDSDFVQGAEAPMRPLLTYNSANYTAGMVGIPVDFDLDGLPNIWDVDSDNDGIPDLIESGGVDVNGDGRVDIGTEFADTNSNGLHDDYEQSPLLRSDPDGSSTDGRPQDTDATGSPYALADADQDAFPNSLDADADNDGRHDLVEIANALADTDNDGRLDAFIDSNHDGMDDAAAASGRITTEADGANNDGRPSDSGDANSSPYVSTLPAGTLGDLNGDSEVDKDGDGLPNFLDTDADNDGLPDSLEDANADGQRSGGETDSYDADTDDDQLIDGIEDANQDGVYTYDETDPRNPDTDGDTLGDGVEDTNLNGTVQPDESDPRDPCDPVPSGACIGVRLAPRMLLMGALLDNANGSLMRDDLRKANVIPLLSPYLDGLVVDTTVLQVGGADAIVDWVLLELRDHTDPTIVVARQSVLLQRDGDVVDIDGSSPVYFPLLFPGDFYVVLKHRNHLGVMTADSYPLNPVVTPIDFTKLSTPLYQVSGAQEGQPTRNYGGQRVLWSGNLNGDRQVVFQGPGNDRIFLGLDIFSHPQNIYFLANFVANGYYNSDTNLDGKVILQGPTNDRNPILFHTVFQTPYNIDNSANYSVPEQLPSDQ